MTLEREAKVPAPIGVRVAKYRELRNFTAAQLAELIPSPGLSRSVIVNIENGRKRDLTSSELMQVASGLRVPVIALLIDMDDPWAQVQVPLPEPFSDITNAQYVVENAAIGLDHLAADWQSTSSHRANSIVASLRELEHLVFDIAALRAVNSTVDIFKGKRFVPLDRPDGTWSVIAAEELREESISGQEVRAAKLALGLVRDISWAQKFTDLPEWLIVRIREAATSVGRFDPRTSEIRSLILQLEGEINGAPSNSD